MMVKILSQVYDMLYGVTFQDGPFFGGVLYEFNYVTGTYTHKHDFQDPTGSLQIGPLIQASNNKIYGITSFGGAYNFGVIFEYDISTSTYTVKYQFDGGTNGANPKGSFMESSNGKLYVFNSFGETFNKGVVIEYDFVNDIVTKKLDFDGANGSFNSQNFFVEICARPTIHITNSTDTLCFGDSLLLYSEGSVSNYTWNNGITDSVWFVPTSTGINTYTATATNMCGTSSDSIQILVNPTYISTLNDSICSGQNYTFPDGSIQSNVINSLIDTSFFSSIFSCDSLIITNLFVKPKYLINETVHVCDGNTYTFPDGSTQTISANLTYNSTLQTQLGCDSIINTVVLFEPIYSIKDTTSVCYGDNFTFPDGFVESNIIAEVAHNSYLQTTYGCDSIVSITVEVDSSYTIDEFIQVCEGDDYLFPDGSSQTNITTPISHTSNLFTINGCDSIVTTNISVNPIFLENETINVCYGSNYIFHDSVEFSSIISDTSHVSTISSVSSCDTIITNSIFVQATYSFSDYDTICKGNDYTFPDGFNLSNVQGDLTHQNNLTTFYGCDSTIISFIHVSSVDTSIQLIGMNLLISNATNITYQWIDCTTNSIITDETNQSFQPDTNGTYAVVLTNTYCSDTSAYISIEGLGINENNSGIGLIELFPNPTHNLVNINFSNKINIGIINIYTIDSKLLESINISNVNQFLIDLGKYQNGTYLIELVSESNKTFKKIIKT